MHRLIYPYLILVVIFTCTSCSNKQYQALFQQRKTIPDTLAHNGMTGTADYHIKPQDILEIRNLQNSKNIVDLNPVVSGASSQGGGNTTQSETYQVEEDGTVALTGLGHVAVAGLTRYEAQNFIEGLYRKAFLKNPIIDLKIVNLKVTMLGEIKGQGNYQLVKDRTTLVEMIGQAGGLTEKADEKTVEIIRGTEKDPQVIIVDLNNIRSINDPSTILQNGDIIYIAQNKRAVRDDNLQNISTLVQPVLLLVDAALLILTLVRK